MSDIDWLKIENRIRATPLDLLQQGIVRRQWEAIDLAYTMLTGVAIPVSNSTPLPAQEKKSEPKRENIKIQEDEDEELVEESDEVEDDFDEEDEDEVDEEMVVKQNKIRTRSSQVHASGKNSFQPDDNDAAEDLAFMPKPEVLAKRKKKHRAEYKKVKVRCTKCGDMESVDPTVAAGTMTKDKDRKMRYVCNSCSCGGR